MNPSAAQILATILFSFAVLHTFSVKRFAHWAHKYPKDSIPETLLHFLAETEVVFGLWAATLFVCIGVIEGSVDKAVHYIEGLNFTNLTGSTLFFGGIALTAITDNAALTYLGSLVQGISPELQYALVAGAVTGGGLTVIANAPNPAGIGILQTAKAFGQEGISPVGLFLGALRRHLSRLYSSGYCENPLRHGGGPGKFDVTQKSEG